MNRSTKLLGASPADRPPSLSDLSPQQQQRLDQLADEFEAWWQVDPQRRIESYLARLTSADAALVLPELINVEVDLRHSRGESLQPAEYEHRFPDQIPAIRWAFDRLHAPQAASSDARGSDTLGVEGDDDPPLEVPEEWGRYRLNGQVGSGSFGVVYRAIDRESGEIVALKFPRLATIRSSQGLDRFLHEAAHAGQLDHPRIVRTIGIARDSGLVAIVQQFIDGADLKSLLAQPRTQAETARLIESLADALAYAHHRGIYHRDLKPANILIDRQGQPYIADFGLALDERQQMSMPRQFCGTTAYMPPEQVAGLTKLLDGRSDIWSLGVILYELLTRRRPFPGDSDSQIVEQIETKDPRPLRQIDPTIDKELQRICLKCLERHQRDRYPTADELAEDLRQWAAHPTGSHSSPHSAVAIVPKGLRSYSAEDAPFFLQLLPGPRDRRGLPASIRFWLSRIVEPVAAENRIPVGVLFGPSGSGKSSFVKAGLLPQLGRDILTVFVESIQPKNAGDDQQFDTTSDTDTEIRLLKALRQRLPGLPEEISLPELLKRIGNGEFLPDSYRKLLIVLDQFEQRLSLPGSFEASQLVRALRYCEGTRLQCLVLVRDDFLMSLARFADALEMDVREGVNAQAIDLFDRRHATAVLAALGRAYGRLPAETEELTAEQEKFLEQAIEQLADHEHIICVRLALFAEMFRHRPWTPTELQKVGGVAGTGERFLEATFGPESRNLEYQALRDPAQSVLERLLPTRGTDIRGSICGAIELQSALQPDAPPNQFQQLLKVLDTDLRLITRTDPYLPGPSVNNSGVGGNAHLASGESQTWYQLTHDYLVPSVRAWLDSNLKKTRAGRAKIRLRDLGNQVIPGQPPQWLPTNWEYFSWQFLLPRHDRRPNELRVMTAARRRFVRQIGLTAALTLAAVGIGSYVYLHFSHRERVNRVNGLISNVLRQEASAVPAIIAQLLPDAELAVPRLEQELKNPQTSEDHRLRLAMSLLPHDRGQEHALIAGVLHPDCDPARLRAIVQVLQKYGGEFSAELSRVLDDLSANPRGRFRAAAALMLVETPARAWAQYAPFLASVLPEEPITYSDGWIEILATQGSELSTTFDQLIRKPDDSDTQYYLGRGKALVLASALRAFVPPETCWSTLGELLLTANEVRFDAILTCAEKSNGQREFVAVLDQLATTAVDPLAQANLAVARARLGAPDSLVELYRGEFNAVPTFLAINFSTADRIRLFDLQQLYRQHQAADSLEVNLRRALLQAMALQSTSVADPAQREWLAQIARQHVLHDPDACCFSTAELIVRRLGSGDIPTLRRQRRIEGQTTGDTPLGRVWINEWLQAFSLVDIPQPGGSVRQLAVCTNEITFGELQAYLKSQGTPAELGSNPLFPFHNYPAGKTLPLIFGYCNFLSASGKSDPDAALDGGHCRLRAAPGIYTFYPADMLEKQSYDLSRNGYRILTEDEWKVACQSNRVLEQVPQLRPPLADNYGWMFSNADQAVHPVSQLLPNAAGLFDTVGNVEEACHTLSQEYPYFCQKGQSWRVKPSGLNLDSEFQCYLLGPEPMTFGFRLAKRWP